MKTALFQITRAKFSEKILIVFLLSSVIISCNNGDSASQNNTLSDGRKNAASKIEDGGEEREEVKKMGTPEGISAAISSEELDLFLRDSVRAFYEKRDNTPAWSSPSLRSALIDTLSSAGNQGLYFEDYHGEEITGKIESIRQLNDMELSELDVILTDAFLKFGNHLLNGKVDPRDIHRIWDTPKNTADKIALLEQAVKNDDLEIALSRLRPLHPIYNQLIASSKEYSELKKEYESFEKIRSGDIIKPGMEDERLPEIKSRLHRLGHLQNDDTTGTRYTKEVQDAVKSLQKEHGVQIDGLIGNNTVELLNTGYDKRHKQILVNLERWRWYSRDLGDHYLIVNIANYWLHVVKQADTVSTHKTMVGIEGRRTPVFSDVIEYVVFNPTWTIPPTIKNEDVIPGMRKNMDYLVNRNIKIFDQSENEVDPSKVDWYGEEPRELIYRQGPGPTNPLGRVKIMYPNKYLIYLHDTPSQGLFEQNVRAESSGCVRVENAVDLAKYLLSDQEQITSREIDDIISSGDTKRINIDQEVKVHHFYWTAWRENGKTLFTKDIYNYDNKTWKALMNAS